MFLKTPQSFGLHFQQNDESWVFSEWGHSATWDSKLQILVNVGSGCIPGWLYGVLIYHTYPEKWKEIRPASRQVDQKTLWDIAGHSR